MGGLAAARIVPGIYAGPKDIAVYPYSGHEGGGTRHFLAQLAFAGQV